MRHDARAGLQREEPRAQLQVHVGKEIERHDGRLREIGLEKILLAEFRARFHARQLRVVAAPLHQAGHDLHAQPARPELLRRGDHDAPVAGAQVDHVILRTHAREPQHRKGHIVGRGDERHVLGGPHSSAGKRHDRGGDAQCDGHDSSGRHHKGLSRTGEGTRAIRMAV